MFITTMPGCLFSYEYELYVSVIQITVIIHFESYLNPGNARIG
jgi:hypothetical protein